MALKGFWGDVVRFMFIIICGILYFVLSNPKEGMKSVNKVADGILKTFKDLVRWINRQ